MAPFPQNDYEFFFPEKEFINASLKYRHLHVTAECSVHDPVIYFMFRGVSVNAVSLNAFLSVPLIMNLILMQQQLNTFSIPPSSILRCIDLKLEAIDLAGSICHLLTDRKHNPAQRAAFQSQLVMIA